MIVSYCKSCLPNKIVLGFNEKIVNLRTPHQAHPQTKKNGWFPVSLHDWNAVFVDGNDDQTKANIVAQLGEKFK
jgi:hypothetical protein